MAVENMFFFKVTVFLLASGSFWLSRLSVVWLARYLLLAWHQSHLKSAHNKCHLHLHCDCSHLSGANPPAQGEPSLCPRTDWTVLLQEHQLLLELLITCRFLHVVSLNAAAKDCSCLIWAAGEWWGWFCALSPSKVLFLNLTGKGALWEVTYKTAKALDKSFCL